LIRPFYVPPRLSILHGPPPSRFDPLVERCSLLAWHPDLHSFTVAASTQEHILH
jgi:hypothetical protein